MVSTVASGVELMLPGVPKVTAMEPPRGGRVVVAGRLRETAAPHVAQTGE